MNDTKRLTRLTAILTQLQTKRVISSTELAAKFEVSVRTIYRDVKALEQAGVPVVTVDGKGYAVMDGYRLPPIMFSESEANALITAEQLVLKNKDASFVKEYSEAIAKIKSVLKLTTKDKANLLSDRIFFRHNQEHDRTSNYLSVLQLALTNLNLAKIDYQTPEAQQATIRIVEAFALYSTQENWLLIAFCRLRKEYRVFRLDRILKLEILNEKFAPHLLTLDGYFKLCNEKNNSQGMT